MPKYFKNRTAKEFKEFLEAHGWKWINSNGDDEIWAHEPSSCFVKVPNRDSEIIILPTADSMAQKIVKSGVIKKRDILAWWKDNGFGE